MATTTVTPTSAYRLHVFVGIGNDKAAALKDAETQLTEAGFQGHHSIDHGTVPQDADWSGVDWRDTGNRYTPGEAGTQQFVVLYGFLQ